MDESGAEMFTVLLPVGTPLPAHRHHILRGDGKLSSLCLEIYQRFITEQPEKLSKVSTNRLPASCLPAGASHSLRTALEKRHNKLGTMSGDKSPVTSFVCNTNTTVEDMKVKACLLS